MAAAARAAHLIVDDEPWIFADTLAYTILGEQAEELLSYHRKNGDHLVLSSARAAVVARSRFTEDRLAASDVRQYVILGAGLDTSAYRSTLDVRVFEVDHPATQEWKKQLLSAASLAEWATFVPVDFETDSLLSRLIENGFDPLKPALVSWLGVVMYLTRDAIDRTVSEIAKLAPGTELVVDYMLPADLRDERGQTYVDMVAPNAAEGGEPWLSFFAPADMSDVLADFDRVSHFSQHESVPSTLWDRSDVLVPSGLSMIAHAVLG